MIRFWLYSGDIKGGAIMKLLKGTVCGICLLSLCATAGAAEKEHLKLYRQGVEANKKGNLDEAIRYYSKSIALKPGAAGLYYVRGRAYQGKGNFDTAIADFNRAVALKPRYAEAYNHRGVTYIGKGMDKEALADFKKACGLGLQDGCANTLKLDRTAGKPERGAKLPFP
jgi:tetratricopeptide (TPR) repeat protein